MQIKPIETRYKGYRFRSRTEARWAVFFDALGAEWEYEPEGFTLPNGKGYLPDFRIKCWGMRGGIRKEPFYLYIEVKGEMTEEDAEKIRLFCGIEDLFDNLWCQQLCSDCREDHENCSLLVWKNEGRFPYPVLVVGNIPPMSSRKSVFDSYVFKSYDEMNGVDIYPFNYQTIDGDYFAAYPAATADGKFYLWGDDCNYINEEDVDRVYNAYCVALSARFEHGEAPQTAKINKGSKNTSQKVWRENTIPEVEPNPQGPFSNLSDSFFTDLFYKKFNKNGGEP